MLYDAFERVSSCSDFMIAIQGKVENDAKRIAEARAVWEDYLHRVDGALSELPALVQGNIATEIAEAHKIFNSLPEFLAKIQDEAIQGKYIKDDISSLRSTVGWMEIALDNCAIKTDIYERLDALRDLIDESFVKVKLVEIDLDKFKNGKDSGRDIRKLVRRFLKEELNYGHVDNKIYHMNVKLKEADLLSKKGLEKSIELRSNFNELYSELQAKYNDLASQLNSSLGDYIEAKIIALTSSK